MMDGNVLGALMLANINGVPQPPIDRNSTFRALGLAIVTHLNSFGIGKGSTQMGTWAVQVEAGVNALAPPAPPAPLKIAPLFAAFASIPTTGIASELTIIQVVSAWASSTGYSLDDVRANGPRIYTCTTAGTSAGAGGPTGAGYDIVDGTVHWKYLADVAGGTLMLNGHQLGDDIKAAVEGVTPPASPAAMPTYRVDIFRAMGSAVVDYLVANGIGIASVPMVLWMSQVEAGLLVPPSPSGSTFNVLPTVGISKIV